ncbi:phenylacetate--CoA ligase family protein [Spirosoma panaciterrae]|uniref:phenylacetate--CoA ligase family protein n=1 Tax=Spirosoma panaciterrae TaxID=496058 RepID=UPI00037BDA4C|nr:phenylacetate--CoA ligase family protein [Spirosoma panaciterrae]
MLRNHFIQENIFLPLSDVVTGQSVSKHLKFLQKSKYWSREQLDVFQHNRLKLLVKHAYAHVPFYRDLFDDLRLLPEDIQTKYDLLKLPVTSKSTLKKEGIERFTSQAYPKKLIKSRASSGSTGEPLHYLSTKESYSVNLAAILRGWFDMGFQLGDKYVKLSGNQRKSIIKKIQDAVSSNRYISVDPMNDETFRSVLEIFEDYQPAFIRCYPDLLLFLANYKMAHPEYMFSPKAIATTGNMLFPEVRAKIESAFGCKIFDSYSCEGNSCVFECPTHTCYHSAEEYGITEVLDSNGTLIKSGIGRLITTDLWNLAYPFIRYDTQDLVEVDETPCACGRSHLRINKIIGRENETLIMPNGKNFIVHQFTIFFSSNENLKRSIEQFQVIKTKTNEVCFNLIVNEAYNLDIQNYLINYWAKEFGSNVFVNTVDAIPLLCNNKRRFIINE